MPFTDREPSVRSRKRPTGQMIDFPTCGLWTCDDYEDWDVVGPNDPDYAAVKRERDIAMYHQPRGQWATRLQEERDRRSGGDPLWWGKPNEHSAP